MCLSITKDGGTECTILWTGITQVMKNWMNNKLAAILYSISFKIWQVEMHPGEN